MKKKKEKEERKKPNLPSVGSRKKNLCQPWKNSTKIDSWLHVTIKLADKPNGSEKPPLPKGGDKPLSPATNRHTWRIP